MLQMPKYQNLMRMSVQEQKEMSKRDALVRADFSYDSLEWD